MQVGVTLNWPKTYKLKYTPELEKKKIIMSVFFVVFRSFQCTDAFTALSKLRGFPLSGGDS